MENVSIKIGVWRNGALIRVVGEMDLINQKSHRTKDDAIYLIQSISIKDPRETLTDNDINTFVKAIKQQFKDGAFNFKTDCRQDADKFIDFNTSNWNCIRPLQSFESL